MRRPGGISRSGNVSLLVACFWILSGNLASSAPTGFAGEARSAPPVEFDYFPGMAFDPAIPSPESFLGYQIGDRFTRHHDAVAYLQALAASSDRVIAREYGRSWEHRPLMTLVISSPGNITRIGEILSANRELTEPDALSTQRLDEIASDNPSIVWLSFGVHGNEASTTETAMVVAYQLASGRHRKLADILDKVVVVIDPQLNPDGHARYTSWYEQQVGARPDPSHDSTERHEPWPGGRTNHYMFDLNRDWLWLTQPESRSRLPMYRRVMPHLHIDCHEQGFRSPYFFGPGDTPYGEHIPQSTKDWLEIYGDHNREVFDARGLEFSTRERFDYLYPGYGKVLPCYHGAVGLLTEQAGHSFAGLRVEISPKRDLTLRRRAFHHFLTSMSYLETTASNREGQIRRFADFFAEAVRKGEEDPFIVAFEAHGSAHTAELVELCEAHGIRFQRYLDGDREMIVADARQPMGAMLRMLFEEQTLIEDRNTYDITSWRAPDAFGVRARVMTSLPESWTPARGARAMTPALWGVDSQTPGGGHAGAISFIIDPGGPSFARVAGEIASRDIITRRTGDSVTFQSADGASHAFATGSIIINAIANPDLDLATLARDIEAIGGVRAMSLRSTMPAEGLPLGANTHREMPVMRVAIVRGSPGNANSFGQHWWLFDVEQPLPLTVIDADRLSRTNLDRYTAIVLPDGMRLSGQAEETISAWVRAGGVLVTTGSSADWAGQSLLSLSATPEETRFRERVALNTLTYAQREERSVDNRIPGATLKVEIDTTHPLSAGMDDWVSAIVRSDRRMPLASGTHVIGRYASSPRLNGSISDRNEQRLAGQPFWTMDSMGRGRVIRIAQDTTIRGFQKAAMRMVINSVIYGPGL